jgi:uncharacterized protein (DUF3084 family)
MKTPHDPAVIAADSVRQRLSVAGSSCIALASTVGPFRNPRQARADVQQMRDQLEIALLSVDQDSAMTAGDDQDLRNRLQHVVEILRPLAAGKGKLNTRETYLHTLLAIVELQAVLLFIGLRTRR